jgi:FdhD protein
MMSLPPHPDPRLPGVRVARCRRFPQDVDSVANDPVVVEEPIELRIGDEALATVMRTPGDDRDLALGFLFAEGVIDSPRDIGALAFCERDEDRDSGKRNVVTLHLDASAAAPSRIARRLGPAMSSCGVCGKQSIDDALLLRPPPERPQESSTVAPGVSPWLDPNLLAELPTRLREEQLLFTMTGALHGAAIFDETGAIRWVREDIGRHNAVDKVVGAAFHDEALPLSRTVLHVSGRVSFEIVQKAYRAGIPVLGAVSGVSSLAIDLAESVGMSLAGFVRDGRFTLYADGGHLKER